MSAGKDRIKNFSQFFDAAKESDTDNLIKFFSTIKSVGLLKGGLSKAWGDLSFGTQLGLEATAAIAAAEVIKYWGGAKERAYKKSSEELKALKEHTDAIDSERESLKDLTKQYEELGSKQTKTKEDEQALRDIETKVNSIVDGRAAGIDLVNGAYSTQMEVLDKLSKEQVKLNKSNYIAELSSAVDASKNAFVPSTNRTGLLSDLENSLDWIQGFNVAYKGNEDYTEISSILNDIEGVSGKTIINSLTRMVDGINLAFDADNAREYYDIISDVINAMETNTSFNHYESGLYRQLVGLRNQYGQIVDETESAAVQAIEGTTKVSIATAGDVISSIDEYAAYVDKIERGISNSSDFKGAIEDGAVTSDDARKIAAKAVASFFPEFTEEFDRQEKRNNNVGAIKKRVSEMNLHGGDTEKARDISSWVDSLNDEQIDILYNITASEDSQYSSFEELKTALANAEVNSERLKNTVSNVKATVESAMTSYGNLQSAWSDSMSSGGMSPENIKTVLDTFGKIEGFDMANLFATTEHGVTMNADAFKKYSTALQEMNQKDVLGKLNSKIEEYNELTAKGGNNSKRAESLKKDIEQYSLLYNALEASTSKYNQYIQATSAANQRDSFENVAKGYSSVKQLIKDGWVGDGSVTSYLDLMLGDNWKSQFGDANSAFEQLTTNIKGTNSTLKDYFSFDKNGNLTADGLSKYATDLVKLGYAQKDGNEISIDYSGEKIFDIADALGTTVEMIDLIRKAQSDAGWDVNFDTPLERVETLRQRLERLNKEKATAEKENKDTSGIEKSLSAGKNQLIKTAVELEIESNGNKLDKNATIDELLNLPDDELVKKLNLEGTEINVDSIRSQLEGMKEVPLNVKLDESQLNQILGTEPVQLSVDVEDVPEEKLNPDGTIHYAADYSGIGLPPDQNAVVHYTADYSGAGKSSGTMLSVAKADGTAYNVLNYKRLSPSHAGGNVSLPRDEIALTNEVG